MLTKKGFTIVEMMIVIMIVAILVAIAIPIMRRRVDSAKWTEGRSLAGALATALRIYGAEHGPGPAGGPDPYGQDKPDLIYLGLNDTDMQGSYFNSTSYSWMTAYDISADKLVFTVTINRPPEVYSPDSWQLDENGVWSSSDP